MLGFAWLTLRQAQEALKNGRLEEALRLLSQPGAQDQRGAGAQIAQLARAFAERGERFLRQDDVEAAWRDLLQAEQLQTAERAPERLRQALTRLGLAEVRAFLVAGDPTRADEAISRLKVRGMRSTELQPLEDAARNWIGAREMADRGEFNTAVEALDRVRRLLPDAGQALEQYLGDLEQRQRAFAEVQPRLHDAAAEGRWREVAEYSEKALAFAPLHAEARRVRNLAWKAAEPATIAMGRNDLEPDYPAPQSELPPRFVLWIDGVGGYLVCLGSRISLGQAGPGCRADVPLVADVARLHGTLTRDAEGYLLEAPRDVHVNGQPAQRVLLRSGDRLTLGTSCQLLFRQPVAVSTTARLELVSGHRLPLSLDGVLLMSDTLILGPGQQTHVTVSDLKQPIVLFRHKDGLGIRHAGALTIDGQRGPERALLGPRAAVTSEEVSFALEPYETTKG
jgi:tetratricopeptide (TPR) repeat protein